MTFLITALTLRELLGQRRIWALLVLASVPVAVAVLFRLGDRQDVAVEFTEVALLAGIVTTGVLPVIAVVIATSALGNEFEDMTALFLLAKPIARSEIVIGKWLAAAVVIVLLVVPASAGGAWLALGGGAAADVIPGFTLAFVLAACAYSAVLLALSIITSRALVVGLVYAFLWEGAMTTLFKGARVLSIRQFTLGLADAWTPVPGSRFEAKLEGEVAFAGIITTIVLGLLVAAWRLSRWEAGESL
ncbi:MAG: ABC transporter permease [Dehalococcoidia bacterium]